MSHTNAYTVRRRSRSRFLRIRGLAYHALQWGDADLVTPQRPPLVMLHGWMDVAASFQFIVDALHVLEGDARCIVALDWRGFGLSESPKVDTYWLPDYLGDLDAALDALFPAQPVDLLGHSMGGNVAMIYAGVRPQRIRRLVNLEGFGMPDMPPQQAPKRLAQWLDELGELAQLLPYDSVDAVAGRLRRNNPLLPADRAAWLAPHWASANAHGQWEIRADAAHKRVNPVLYRADEILSCWRLITAPVLWVEGDQTDIAKWWGTRYTKAEFHQRLGVVAQVTKRTLSPAGHMLHHDQPAALAQQLRTFLDHAAAA